MEINYIAPPSEDRCYEQGDLVLIWRDLIVSNCIESGKVSLKKKSLMLSENWYSFDKMNVVFIFLSIFYR